MARYGQALSRKAGGLGMLVQARAHAIRRVKRKAQEADQDAPMYVGKKLYT